MALDRARALELFRLLGAKDPEAWADGEARDDRPYLVRYLFLTGLWRAVLGDDAEWTASDPATQRLLAKGADPRDLAAVIRQAQCDILYEVCQLIDDPSHGIEDLQAVIPENVEWRLAEVDANERPTGRVVLDLHASLGKFDPTGRNGEPRADPPGRKRRAATRRR
jgi:hypothetical protein